MSLLTRLRRFWLDVHLWLGVALFIPLVVLGVTGTVLTFHHEFDRLVAPQRYEVSAGAPASMQDWVDAARVALGSDYAVTGVRPPEDAQAPVLVQARARAQPPEGQRPETRTAYVDPASARVLDIANTRADAFGIMHQLHGSLMIPEIGRKVVGWLGWAMLVSSLTGLWLWWPRGALLRGLAWKRSPRTTSNLHHFTGFWIALPLAALSFTGAYISFPQFSRSVLATFVALPDGAPRGPGGRGPGGGALPIETPHLSADAVAEAALSAAPGARLISVNLPTPARGDGAPSWRVLVKAPEVEANVTINVADDTGLAEIDAPAVDQNVARLMRRIHDGTDLGVVWRVIIALAGLAPALLGVTGIVMWLRRRAARRAIRRGHAPNEASS